MARTTGANAFTENEKRLIEIALQGGHNCAAIARLLGRERSGVWRQVQRIKAAQDRQPCLPLGGDA